MKAYWLGASLKDANGVVWDDPDNDDSHNISPQYRNWYERDFIVPGTAKWGVSEIRFSLWVGAAPTRDQATRIADTGWISGPIVNPPIITLVKGRLLLGGSWWGGMVAPLKEIPVRLYSGGTLHGTTTTERGGQFSFNTSIPSSEDTRIE